MTNDEFERLIELTASGGLTPVVDRELPLAEAAEAHRLIEAPPALFIGHPSGVA